MKYKVGFIGCGNMGGALLGAVIKNIGAENCCVSEKASEKASPFTALGVSLLSLPELCLQSECIFLAVKPQVMGELLSEISQIMPPESDTLFVTMAAGLEISTIEKHLGRRAPVIRIMPNLPCALGVGVLLYCCNDLVREDKRASFLKELDGVGLIDEIEEDKIDAASVVSGCGPAFVYLFAEALANGAKECGLEKEKAVLYAVNTLIGAATVIKNSSDSIENLVNAVCSPKGSTIEGVDALKSQAFEQTVKNAVHASFERTKELKKISG